MAGLREVSSFANVEAEIAASDKDQFDWVRDGNLEKVKQLLEAKPSLLLSKDKSGMTMLHWAADRAHADLMSLILQDDKDTSGLLVDIQDEEGNTALHLAYWSEATTCIDILLKYGARTDILNGEGDTFSSLSNTK